MKNEIELKPTYWASVSGGKDSLYMLNLILHNLDKYQLNGVVHFELEIDYPFIKNVIDYMERECRKFNIPFVRIKPTVSWYDLYKEKGMPTRKVRWCNGSYKMNACKQLENFFKDKGYKVIHYIGYCVDEFKRYENRKNYNEIYPLVDFNIEESTILDWAKDIPLFNNYYKFNTRCGCMYCPMSSYKNLAYLKVFYPDKFNEFMKMAKDTEALREKELGRPFSIWQSNPKYNTDYIIKRLDEKYIKKIYENL